jgi:Rieske Fe-S protein
MNRPSRDLGRRTFLKMVGCAAAANACGSGPAGPADVGDVAAGNVQTLAPGSLNAVPGQPVCVGRDAGGVYAMTLICTHQGCEIGSVSAGGLFCGCHGSAFDAHGNVVRGPASTSLAHFAVSADMSGNLTVHTGTEVAADTRLTVG